MVGRFWHASKQKERPRLGFSDGFFRANVMTLLELYWQIVIYRELISSKEEELRIRTRKTQEAPTFTFTCLLSYTGSLLEEPELTSIRLSWEDSLLPEQIDLLFHSQSSLSIMRRSLIKVKPLSLLVLLLMMRELWMFQRLLSLLLDSPKLLEHVLLKLVANASLLINLLYKLQRARKFISLEPTWIENPRSIGDLLQVLLVLTPSQELPRTPLSAERRRENPERDSEQSHCFSLSSSLLGLHA